MDTKAYLKSCLEKVVEEKGQDIFFKAGVSPRVRHGGTVTPLSFPPLSNEEMSKMIKELLSPSQLALLEKDQGVDFGYSFEEAGCRLRGNAFYQQGDLSLVFRLLWKGTPSFEQLHLPPILKKVALEKSGIILVAGVVSSGKTTTLAAMVDAMNQNVEKHILTLEDPVEFIYEDKKCIIQQREVGQDTPSFSSALKYAVRQSPDVVLIGEMRDAETFRFALSAAEVGRLVLSTVHAQSVGQVFDRVLGFFGQDVDRNAILQHFAANLTCIAVQKLLIGKDGITLYPAVEILLGTYTIKQLVMEHKIDKIPQALRNANQEGMQTMDQALFQLYESGAISKETALSSSASPQDLESLMKGFKIGQGSKILGD